MKNRIPTDRFKDWSNGEIDRFLTALECHMVNHAHTPDELENLISDINEAQQALEERLNLKQFDGWNWDVDPTKAGEE